MASVYRIQSQLVWFGCQYICAAANRSNATFHTRIIVNKMIRKRIRTTKYKFVRGRSRCCFFRYFGSTPENSLPECKLLWLLSLLITFRSDSTSNEWMDWLDACKNLHCHSLSFNFMRWFSVQLQFFACVRRFFSAERMNLEVTFLDIGNGFFPSCSRHCLFSLSVIVETQSKFCYGWT